MTDYRLKIADREALILVLLFLLNVIWWASFAYGLGSRPVEAYSYILGFPDWFFFSCVLSWPLFSLILYVVVRKFFVEVPLEAYVEGGENERAVER